MPMRTIFFDTPLLHALGFGTSLDNRPHLRILDSSGLAWLFVRDIFQSDATATMPSLLNSAALLLISAIVHSRSLSQCMTDITVHQRAHSHSSGVLHNLPIRRTKVYPACRKRRVVQSSSTGANVCSC